MSFGTLKSYIFIKDIWQIHERAGWGDVEWRRWEARGTEKVRKECSYMLKTLWEHEKKSFQALLEKSIFHDFG